MFTYYPMYSSTYASPEQFDASMTPYYRIVVSTGLDRVELACNAPDNLVRDVPCGARRVDGGDQPAFGVKSMGADRDWRPPRM